MFKNFLNFIYPFVSLSIIEVGTWFNQIIEFSNNILSFIIFLLQISIAILTIFKIYKDLNNKKFKSVEHSEKSIEKKNKLMFALFSYLKQKF